jgi:hypothetical protein
VTVASTKHALLTALLFASIAAAQDTKRVVLVQPSRELQWTLQLVSDITDPITLDAYSQDTMNGSPSLEVFAPNSAYLHFYGSYGIYAGSVKYLFDLTGAKPVAKIPYSILALTSVVRKDSKLYYSASSSQPERHTTIVIEPRAAALPSYRIIGSDTSEPATFRAPSGEVVIQNTTPPGQSHRPSTIFVGVPGTPRQSYPAPIPTLDFYAQTLPQKHPPFELESDIGPFVQSADRIWFATTFYDSEGTSGIGAIGSFDIATRQYEMRYLPEIAPWSGSAILLDGDDLWIGLLRHPEGADIAAGLLRYNLRTTAVESIAIPDIIFTLDRAGDALYCGTSHGLYVVRGSQITQMRFEPDASGQLVMIPREK